MIHAEKLEPYTYRWDERCFPLGADCLALGEFCTVKPRNRVLDLGCGAGALLLLCARRCPDVALTGVEIDPVSAQWARENLESNGLAGEILNGDFRDAELPANVELVVSNPPWYPRGQAGDGKRVELRDVHELCHAASQALRNRGRFALVHRPERLVEVMAALRKTGLEPKRLQLCRGKPDKPPYAALVEAVKGGRPGLEILPERIG